MIEDFSQQKKEIEILIKNKNFKRNEYLNQFRSEIRDKIASLIPRDLKLSLENNNTKGIKAKCVSCQQEYMSVDCGEELGKCDFCCAKEYRAFLKLDPFEFSSGEHRNRNRKKIVKNVVPWRLGENLILQISMFFAEKYYIKREFRFKNNAIEPIFKKFGVKLTPDELGAISNKSFLKKRNLTYQFS